MDCLKNVIGLTQTPEFCYEAEIEGFEALNESYSGHYVDNLEHGPDLLVKTNNQSVYQMLIDSRNEGLEDLITAYTWALSGRTKSTIDSTSDIVGQFRKTNYTNTTTQKSVLGIKFRGGEKFLGVSLRINRVGLKVDTAGTYNLTLTNINTQEAVSTKSITVSAGVLEYVTFDALIKLSDKYNDRVRYAVTYERGSAKSYNFETYCGSCGSKNERWYTSNLLYTGSVNEDTIEDIEYDFTGDTQSNGIILDVTFECNFLDWACEKPTTYWSKNAFGRSFAKAYQLYSDIKLITKIIDTGQSSAYTSINGEQLIYKRSALRKTVNAMVSSLADNQIMQMVNHCYGCKPSHGMNVIELIL